MTVYAEVAGEQVFVPICLGKLMYFSLSCLFCRDVSMCEHINPIWVVFRAYVLVWKFFQTFKLDDFYTNTLTHTYIYIYIHVYIYIYMYTCTCILYIYYMYTRKNIHMLDYLGVCVGLLPLLFCQFHDHNLIDLWICWSSPCEYLPRYTRISQLSWEHFPSKIL